MNVSREMHFSAVRRYTFGLIALLSLAVYAADSNGTDTAIDWARARALHEKSLSGAELTTEERAYLTRAVAMHQARSPIAEVIGQLSPAEQEQARGLIQKRQSHAPLTDAERALQTKIQQMLDARRGAGSQPGSPPQPPRDHTGLVPLDQMSAQETYHGLDGGLYGGGRNQPPAALAAAAVAEAAHIVPRDARGEPSAAGRIALLSVGMSNTTQEYSRFQELADADSAKDPHVTLVDGAQGGQAAAQWVSEERVWQTVDARLQAAGVTAAQVQVAWLKQAEIRPTEPFPRDAEKLAEDEARIVQRLKTRFPNLRLVYLSSRIYAGYATTALNPEPYAYESGFAVRMLIQRQLAGDPALNWDAAHGAVRAPLLLWGPYLWADGMTPRRSDGLNWRREDLREDGTHPSATTGRTKVAQLLLTFFKTDATAKRWFTRPATP